jgi:signal transduction histidine kinase
MALEQVRSSGREAITEMEAMLDQLRTAPLGNAGLVDAVKKQCEALGSRTGARVEFKLGTLPPGEALTPGAQQAVLRVAQEALANVGRHAHARNVTVALDATGHRFELWVRDDGSGFDQNQASGGTGIANMHARAEEFDGALELGSHPGGGTWVHFEIPYAVETPGEYRQRALTYGALLVFCIFFVIFTKSTGAGLVGALLASIGLVREAIAYWRVRKQVEAAV